MAEIRCAIVRTYRKCPFQDELPATSKLITKCGRSSGWLAGKLAPGEHFAPLHP